MLKKDELGKVRFLLEVIILFVLWFDVCIILEFWNIENFFFINEYKDVYIDSGCNYYFLICMLINFFNVFFDSCFGLEGLFIFI